MRVYGTTFDITLINKSENVYLFTQCDIGRHLAGIDPINDRDYQ